MVEVNFFPASQVKQEAPQKHGIYAWYYLPQFGNADVNQLIGQIEAAGEDKARKEVVLVNILDVLLVDR